MMVNYSGYPELDSDIGPSELSDIAEEPEEGLTDSDEDRMTPHFSLPSQQQQQQLLARRKESTRGQCYKTFYGRKLRLFIIS
jgi:hypothetical protein